MFPEVDAADVVVFTSTTGQRWWTVAMFLGGNKPADGYDQVSLGAEFTRANWTVGAGLANVTNEKGVLSITGAPASVGSLAQYLPCSGRVRISCRCTDY